MQGSLGHLLLPFQKDKITLVESNFVHVPINRGRHNSNTSRMLEEENRKISMDGSLSMFLVHDAWPRISDHCSRILFPLLLLYFLQFVLKKDKLFLDTIISGFHMNVDILIMLIFITVCIRSLQVS